MQRFPGKVWAWWLAAEGGLGVFYLDTNFWQTPFLQFLKEPLIGSLPTYGMLVGLAVLGLLLILPPIAWLASLFHRQSHQPSPSIVSRWMPSFLTGQSETALIVRSSVILFGLIATLIPTPVFAHYFIVLFPVSSLWLVRMWLHNTSWRDSIGRTLLWTMLLLQLFVSLTTVFYVHSTFGTPDGLAQFNSRTPE